MLPADPLFERGRQKQSIPSWEWEEEGKLTNQLKDWSVEKTCDNS